MKGKLLIFSALVVLSAVLGVAVYVFHDTIIAGLFYTSLVLAVTYLIFSIFLGVFLLRRITDLKTRYTANKAISIVSIGVIIALCLRIWITDTSSLIVSYGIIGAAIAFALQDIFKNFVGGILIMVSGLYRVGDRISIVDKYGDVMDIGVLFTTLMEIRGWISGDQPSGRLLLIPNGIVINNPLFNYTRDHSFIWDEISIPLTYTSDWRLAKDLILDIVKKETASMTQQADAEIERIGEKYYLPKKVVEPSAYISLTDNWIMLEVRYVTDVRTRRLHRTHLSELIMEAIEKEERITISSTTVTVTTISQVSTPITDKKLPDT